jgi:DNA-binding GntR family transcriptional regulator
VGALDGVAARLTAELDARRRERVVRKMTAVNARLSQVSARADSGGARLAQALDRRFHHCYETAGAGPRLRSKIEMLQARRERYVRLYTEALVHGHDLPESLSEHDAIIAAIRDGDADAAERAAAYNHRHAIERYHRIAASLGQRGGWS